MSLLERFSKWLQLKVYQVEVTFSVYMFTPLEKLFFCKPRSPVCSPVIFVGSDTNHAHVKQGPSSSSSSA